MKRCFPAIVCICMLSSFLPFASVSKSTDISQGFNFSSARRTSVGYLTSFQVGSAQYTADIQVKDPQNPSASFPVVGVMSAFQWAGGIYDAINLSVQVSTANKQQAGVMTLSANALAGPATLGFVVYEFDPVAQKYFKSVYHTTAALSGTISKAGTDYNFAVADAASAVVQSPMNYTLSLGVSPQAGIAQKISLAGSSTSTFFKVWGN